MYSVLVGFKRASLPSQSSITNTVLVSRVARAENLMVSFLMVLDVSTVNVCRASHKHNVSANSVVLWSPIILIIHGVDMRVIRLFSCVHACASCCELMRHSMAGACRSQCVRVLSGTDLRRSMSDGKWSHVLYM